VLSLLYILCIVKAMLFDMFICITDFVTYTCCMNGTDLLSQRNALMTERLNTWLDPVLVWPVTSSGRASASRSWGQRFESEPWHHGASLGATLWISPVWDKIENDLLKLIIMIIGQMNGGWIWPDSLRLMVVEIYQTTNNSSAGSNNGDWIFPCMRAYVFV
jgi:hypothetical protein